MADHAHDTTESAKVDCFEGICVIIPAQNEEESLPLVLADLPRVGRVIVADNDSSDSTPDVARKAGADVVFEPRRGYGSACLAGMQAIVDSIEQGDSAPEIVVFLDGDYSDHPDRLAEIVDPIFENRADMVLGSRLMGQREKGAMPPQAVYGNKLACFLIGLVWRVRFTDLGPFRAIRYQKLLDLGMQDINFGWTVEMQVKAIRNKLRILEVPVPYRCRVGVSKISGTISGTIRAGYKILFTIARYALFR